MKRLIHYCYLLTCIGETRGMSYIEQRRVQMVNITALICVPIMFYFSVVNFYEDRDLLSVINFLNASSCITVLFLQYHAKHNVAKIVLLSSSFFFFFIGALFYKNGGEYFLLCILIVSILLYDNIRILLSIGASVIIAIVFIKYYSTPDFVEGSIPKFRLLFNISAALLFISLAISFFKKIIYNNIKQIEDQRQKLEFINHDKEKVFSILAHDVKAPFASLESMVILLREQAQYNDIPPSFINQLYQRITHQNQALDDLLQWSSNSMKGIVNMPISVRIKPIIEDVIKIFEEQLVLKQLKIQVRIDDDMHVYVDTQHIVIVLRNFISNAVKFSHINGDIEIDSSQDPTHTYIHIKDNGVGMHNSQSMLLFNSIQNRSLGTDNEPGTGLGLLLCKDLILRNKGTVSIKSMPNIGSVFTVGFPTDERSAKSYDGNPTNRFYTASEHLN